MGVGLNIVPDVGLTPILTPAFAGAGSSSVEGAGSLFGDPHPSPLPKGEGT